LGHDDKRKGITVNDIPLEHHLEKVEDERRGIEAIDDFAKSSTKHTTYRKPQRDIGENYRRRGTVKIIPKGVIMREQYEPIIGNAKSTLEKVLSLLLTREPFDTKKIKLVIDSVSGGDISTGSVSAIMSEIKKTRVSGWLEVVKPERAPGQPRKGYSYKWCGPDLGVAELAGFHREDINRSKREKDSEERAKNDKQSEVKKEEEPDEVVIPLPEPPSSWTTPRPSSRDALKMTVGDFIESFRRVGLEIEIDIKG